MKTKNITKNQTGRLTRLRKSPFGGFRGLLYVALQVPLWGGLGGLLTSCGDWIDVIPDGIATLDMAFNSRPQALKYLYTCYSYLPKNGGSEDPAILGSDEIYTKRTNFLQVRFDLGALSIAEGAQNAASPARPRWENMYKALRDCNIFIENLHKVPDLKPYERDKWIAEVLVLKAYYHFCLVQMYGPVPLVRENLPIYTDVSSVKVMREPVDECFRYIIEVLDEAINMNALPLEVTNPIGELGRITMPIAKSLKAKILVTAASPLFNGNEDQVTLHNRGDDTPLFNQTYMREKWRVAMVACKEAIEVCDEAFIMLHYYPNMGDRYTPTIATDLSLREAFSSRWNSDIIWANTGMISIADQNGMIGLTMPILNPEWANSGGFPAFFGLPIKIARMFYSKNGVPLEEDKTRDINNLYELRTATAADELYIRRGRTTVDLHFDREPRFYAWVGFDGGIWFGADRIDDKDPINLRYLGMKLNETDGCATGQGNYTGYLPKKYIPHQSQLIATNVLSTMSYAWPIMRISDLYLLYAEAINEYEGVAGNSSIDMFYYIDLVRERAGLKGVKESWDLYANNRKYGEQQGMREIIQRERLIELALEGQRFWDVRRWKTAPEVCNGSIEGWYMQVTTNSGTDEEVNREMYTPQHLTTYTFSDRDYFWPIKINDISINPKLVQNLGW